MTAQKKIEAYYSWRTRPVKLNCLFDYIHSQSEYYISTPTNYSESEKFQNFGEQMSPVVCRGTILGRQESHQTSDLVSCLDSKVKNLKSQEEWSKRSGMRI